MKTIHVCLVSDQTVPNILAAEHFGADELALVSTEKMEAKGKSRHILDCLKARGLDYDDRHHVLRVDQDAMSDCRRQLQGWIGGREASAFTVNLTGGTKIMSIAAFEFFRDYGARMIYIPIPRNEYVTVFPRRGGDPADPLPQRLSVQEYLTAYGLRADNGKHLGPMADAARRRAETARWITENYDGVKMLLKLLGGGLRAHRATKKKAVAFAEKIPEPTRIEKMMLRRMGFEVNGNCIAKALTKSEIHFVTGGWLEEYCYNTVAGFLGQGVDDAAIGTQIKGPKGAANEYDVLFTSENALYTVECKSLDQESDMKAEALYKVAALQRDFGLRVRSFLVSTSPHILDGDGCLKPAVAARADQLNTVVVAPHEVLQFRTCLVKTLKLKI